MIYMFFLEKKNWKASS